MDDTAGVIRDTRSRIQQVALELFTEQGYEKTSLREIAERLGVTKAALYYYFKSKEELVESFVGDRVTEIDNMIEWLRAQPRTAEVRREFIRRYAQSILLGRHQQVMRFFESNQAALKAMPIGLKLRDQFRALLDEMVDRDDPLADQLRIAMGLWALHTSWFVLPDWVTDEQRHAAALEVALDLIDRSDREAQPTA